MCVCIREPLFNAYVGVPADIDPTARGLCPVTATAARSASHPGDHPGACCCCWSERGTGVFHLAGHDECSARVLPRHTCVHGSRPLLAAGVDRTIGRRRAARARRPRRGPLPARSPGCYVSMTHGPGGAPAGRGASKRASPTWPMHILDCRYPRPGIPDTGTSHCRIPVSARSRTVPGYYVVLLDSTDRGRWVGFPRIPILDIVVMRFLTVTLVTVRYCRILKEIVYLPYIDGFPRSQILTLAIQFRYRKFCLLEGRSSGACRTGPHVRSACEGP